MVGNPDEIDAAITALKENELVLKVVKGLQDYLSCKVEFLLDKKRACLGQVHLIKSLEEKFSK